MLIGIGIVDLLLGILSFFANKAILIGVLPEISEVGLTIGGQFNEEVWKLDGKILQPQKGLRIHCHQ